MVDRRRKSIKLYLHKVSDFVIKILASETFMSITIKDNNTENYKTIITSFQKIYRSFKSNKTNTQNIFENISKYKNTKEVVSKEKSKIIHNEAVLRELKESLRSKGIMTNFAI